MQYLWMNEFESTVEDSEREGSLECCSPWGGKEQDTTKQLNNALSFLIYYTTSFTT